MSTTTINIVSISFLSLSFLSLAVLARAARALDAPAGIRTVNIAAAKPLTREQGHFVRAKAGRRPVEHEPMTSIR
jgi:hypothetical protein